MNSKLSWLKEWIALIAALIALITAVLNIVYTVSKISQQENQIIKIAECLGVTTKITEPNDGDEVGGRIHIHGIATPSDVCRNVYIIVREKPGALWKIADIAQTDAKGDWVGLLQLEDISHLGSEIEITARVTSSATDYKIGQLLSTPPVKGIPSTNIINVRRVQ